jgi:hypothetical protein
MDALAYGDFLRAPSVSGCDDDTDSSDATG